MFSIAQIKGKCILLPSDKYWVAIPLLHTLESNINGHIK